LAISCLALASCKSTSNPTSAVLENIGGTKASGRAILISTSRNEALVSLCKSGDIQNCIEDPVQRIPTTFSEMEFHLHATMWIPTFNRPVVDGRNILKEVLNKIDRPLTALIKAMKRTRGKDFQPDLEKLLAIARGEQQGVVPDSEAMNVELTRLLHFSANPNGPFLFVEEIDSESAEVDPLYKMLSAYYFDQGLVKIDQVPVNLLPYTAGTKAGLRSGKDFLGYASESQRNLERINPQYKVCFPTNAQGVGRTLMVGKTEISQQEWFEIMGYNPSRNDRACSSPKVVDGISLCPTLPVDSVSRNEVDLFINSINRRSKLEESDSRAYRLPTNVEWGYFAGGGLETQYSYATNGDQADPSLTHFDCRNRLVLKVKENSTPNWEVDPSLPAFGCSGYQPVPREVRSSCSKAANPFGLCHVLGNVSEWVSDAGGPNNFLEANQRALGKDIFGATMGLKRGGGFQDHEGRVRTDYGTAGHRWQKSVDGGFRVVSGTAPMGDSFIDNSCE
jgi:formylglycine-generating enzyme required for sulfatase activity